MTKYERLGFVALVGLAAGAAAAVLYRILNAGRGEDGPIRVKGGSVIIENDDIDWKVDDEDDPEYFLRPRARYLVRVWAHGPQNPLPDEPREAVGRKVVVKIETNGRVETLVFRANGAARLVDKDKRLGVDNTNRKRLHAPDPSTRIASVAVRDKTQPKPLVYERVFVAGQEKGYIELTLQ